MTHEDALEGLELTVEELANELGGQVGAARRGDGYWVVSIEAPDDDHGVRAVAGHGETRESAMRRLLTNARVNGLTHSPG